MKFHFTILGLVLFHCAATLADQKSIHVPCAHWFIGSIGLSEGVIIGRVTKVESAPSSLSATGEKEYKYLVDVLGSNGIPEIEGIKRFSSITFYPIKSGSNVAILIHYYEKKPDLATSGREPIYLQDKQDPLTLLFLSKGLDWSKYEDADMALIKKRLPEEYEELVSRRQWFFEQKKKKRTSQSSQPRFARRLTGGNVRNRKDDSTDST